MNDDPRNSSNQDSTTPSQPVEPTFPVDQYITESSNIVIPTDSIDLDIA
jgi:hypothetical protein